MNILRILLLLHLFLLSSILAFSQPNRNCNPHPHQFVELFSERFKLDHCQKISAEDLQNFFVYVKESDSLKKYHVIGEFVQAHYMYEKSIWEMYKFPKTEEVLSYYKEAYNNFDTHSWNRTKGHIQFFLTYENQEYFIYIGNSGDPNSPEILYYLLKRVVKVQSMTLVEE